MKNGIITGLIFLSALTSAGQYVGPSESPAVFIENKGQVIDQNNKPNPSVLYLLNTPGMNVQLRRGGFSYNVYRISNIDQRILNFENQSPPHTSPVDTIEHRASSIQYHRIDFDLIGTNPDCEIIASDPSLDYLNYYTTGTPPEGITNIRSFASVTYKNIYPGIDLEFNAIANSKFKIQNLNSKGKTKMTEKVLPSLPGEGTGEG